ncbi:MAG: zinc ABC transporter substrate-binding protein, partial [Sulfurimonas sp.]|nr:zinc ABC transporter substrate-binding protein [Sulfurimonas sp.]
MIKKILILTLFFAELSYAKIHTIVSVLPELTFVEKIGGDKIDIKLMVKPGNSPHSYEPKPSQMKDISNADIYFAIGVE